MNYYPFVREGYCNRVLDFFPVKSFFTKLGRKSLNNVLTCFIEINEHSEDSLIGLAIFFFFFFQEKVVKY